MIKKILISISLLTSSFISEKATAQNYISYQEDTTPTVLSAIIRDQYFESVNNCGPGKPTKGCYTFGFVPPPSPEIWYFVNDNEAELLKYVVSNINGNLGVNKTALTSIERNYSDRIKAVRAETWANWASFESNYPAFPPITQKSTPEYISECAAQGKPENEDSPFDYFRNDALATQLRDAVMAEHPNSTHGEVNSINVGLKGVSFGVSWDTAASHGVAMMADGGRLVFTLAGEVGDKRPVLNLFRSRTHDDISLDSYFAVEGDITNNMFSVKPKEISHQNNCDAEEYANAVRGVNPAYFPELGAGGGGLNFGSCRPHPHFSNYFEVTTMTTITLPGGTSTTTMTVSRVASGGITGNCG